MQITWLGAAGFKIDTDEGAVVLINPFLSRPEGAQPPLPVQLTNLSLIDEILLTDGRFDHAIDTAMLVKQSGAIVHAPPRVCEQLAVEGVSPNNLEEIVPHQTKYVGHLAWQAWSVQSKFVDAWPTPNDIQHAPQLGELIRQWPSKEMVAYTFQAKGLTMIYAGSTTWQDAEIKGLQPDIALLPLEQVPEGIPKITKLAAMLKPQLIIPHHWDYHYPPAGKIVRSNELSTVLQNKAPIGKIYLPTIGQPIDLANLISR